MLRKTAIDYEDLAKDGHFVIKKMKYGTRGAKAGLLAGDALLAYKMANVEDFISFTDIVKFKAFLAATDDEPIVLKIER